MEKAQEERLDHLPGSWLPERVMMSQEYVSNRWFVRTDEYDHNRWFVRTDHHDHIRNSTDTVIVVEKPTWAR